MKKNLTPAMHRAIVMANKNGGKLTRHPGGFWCDTKLNEDEYFSTNTVHGMWLRGVGTYTAHKKNSMGQFPVEFTIDVFYQDKK